MKILVFLTLAILTIGFGIAVVENSDVGKNPDDIITIHKQETNKVTGELLNIEIIKCRLCNEVISYTECNLRGKVLYANSYSHRCRNSYARYKSLGIEPAPWNLIDWLNTWQLKIKLRR